MTPDPTVLPDRADRGDPSVQTGTVGAVIGALIVLLVEFGVQISPGQAVAVLGFVAVAAPPLTALWIRRRAWRPSTVAATVDRVEAAVLEGPPEDGVTVTP